VIRKLLLQVFVYVNLLSWITETPGVISQLKSVHFQ